MGITPVRLTSEGGISLKAVDKGDVLRTVPGARGARGARNSASGYFAAPAVPARTLAARQTVPAPPLD